MTPLHCGRTLQSTAAVRRIVQLANVACPASRPRYGLDFCRLRPTFSPCPQLRRNHHAFRVPSQEQLGRWYDVLQLRYGASLKEVTDQRKILAKKLHSDIGRSQNDDADGRKRNEHALMEVNAAVDGIRELISYAPAVQEQYVLNLLAERKATTAAAAAAAAAATAAAAAASAKRSPPPSRPAKAPPPPSKADLLRAKWKREDDEYQAWVAQQNKAKATVDRQAREDAERKATQDAQDARQSRRNTAFSSQRGTRQQPDAPLYSQQHGAQQSAKAAAGADNTAPKGTRRTNTGPLPRDDKESKSDPRTEENKAFDQHSKPAQEHAEQTEHPKAKTKSPRVNIVPKDLKLVLLQGVPKSASVQDILLVLEAHRPGAVAHIGLRGGVWIEFFTADGASALKRLVENKTLRIKDKVIQQATLQKSPFPPPPRGQVSRVLRITCADPDSLCSQYLDLEKLGLFLRQSGIQEPIYYDTKESRLIPGGRATYLLYASWRAGAAEAKAFLEAKTPELTVVYLTDTCAPSLRADFLERIGRLWRVFVKTAVRIWESSTLEKCKWIVRGYVLLTVIYLCWIGYST